MNKTRKRWNSILWIEGFGFSVLIVLSWLTEAIRIPHLIFGESFHPNYNRAFLRMLVVMMVWFLVYRATRRLLQRLYYLEEFLRVCGWCRKVCHDGKWMGMEEYFNTQFHTRTSHGMCPDCLRKGIADLEKRAAANAPQKAPDSTQGTVDGHSTLTH